MSRHSERRLILPSSLTIEGEQWSFYKEGTEPRRLRPKRPLLAEGDVGRTLYTRRAVLLADGLLPDEQEEIFWHEALHILLKDDQWLGRKLEEHTVELLDGPLARLARQLRYTEGKGGK